MFSSEKDLLAAASAKTSVKYTVIEEADPVKFQNALQKFTAEVLKNYLLMDVKASGVPNIIYDNTGGPAKLLYSALVIWRLLP